jgi:hypothetical protein
VEETGRSGLAAPLWVTAFGVMFAATQLFIMAVSTSLQSVSQWPSVTVEYAQSSDAYFFSIQNAGTGPALIQAINWKLAGSSYRNWDQAFAHFNVAAGDRISWQKISGRVLAANDGTTFLKLKKTPATTALWNRWKTKSSMSDFSVCYCSAMSQSWVGRAASSVAGMPVCWIADRASLTAHPAEGNICGAGDFQQ